LLIADTPAAFAQTVVCLLQEPTLRKQLVDNAYQLVSEKYDWAVVMPRFLHLVERVANA
jgi:glycosyltransferase involved in cell wall biosynthesis